ncbi:MAG: hypothetical protein ACE5G2_08335, partial [Candidatus Krumholzibacteriia bacterium]
DATALVAGPRLLADLLRFTVLRQDGNRDEQRPQQQGGRAPAETQLRAYETDVSTSGSGLGAGPISPCSGS